MADPAAIQNLWVDEYSANLVALLQQRGSKLRGTVTLGSHTGDGAAALNQIGAATTRQKTTRHAASPRNPIPYDRRWVYGTVHDTGTPVDDSIDLSRMLTDPMGSIVQAQAFALGRDMDAEIIRAALGTAQTGEKGTTAVALPASQTIAEGGTRMSYAKMLEAMYRLEEANVDLTIDVPTLVLSAKQKRQLFDDVQLTNAEYVNNKPVTDYMIRDLLGVNIVTIGGQNGDNPILPKSGDTETAVLYTRNGVHLGEWFGPQTFVERDPTHSFEWYVYSKTMFGATRLEEGRVIAIETDSNPA